MRSGWSSEAETTTPLSGSDAEAASPRLSTELLALADTEEHDELTLGGLMDRLQGRIYTLFLILLSLPFCQPVLLPGLSTPFGLVIALLGLRFAFRQHPWLPRRLLETHLSGRVVPAILRASAKLLSVMEKLLHPRMVGLFDRNLTPLTLLVFAFGFVAIVADTAGGILLGKLWCRLSGGRVNPLVGAAGISTYPMAARLVQTEGQRWNKQNFLLMHAMAANTGGQIGSIMAAAIMISVLKALGVL